LADAVASFNDSNAAFIINLGDIIEGNDTDDKTLSDWVAVENALKTLRPKLHSVIGNHCLRLPGPKRVLMDSLHMTESFYVAERRNGYRFLVLDGTEITVKGNEPDSDNYRAAQTWLDAHPRGPEFPHAWDWNAAISQSQLEWFVAQCVDARARGEKVLVFCHYPVQPAAATDEHLLWNHLELVEILNQNSDVVKAYISGHWHHGGYYRDPESGIHHLTLRAILEASTDKGPDCGNAYAFVDVFPTKISLRGCGWAREQSRDMDM
jgi:manganese-dependent ADP-ribose/CDP-alcohol diphosphatase